MKIELLGSPQVIMDNPGSLHNYFAWPTVTRLRDGRIAAAASGYRLAHICPFGKAVMAVSTNEGETYTLPAPIIDTVLDDRDAGLCPFGVSGLILTSFNNTVEFQRRAGQGKEYRDAYLDRVKPEAEAAAIGANFRVSFDNVTTWGPLYHSPITSPHGPTVLHDGTILWLGRTFSESNTFRPGYDCVKAYAIDPATGEMTYRGEIEHICDGEIALLSCEPHAMQMPDGRIVCHIRVQGGDPERKFFTIYQSESTDGGYTWTTPVMLLDREGGSPPHLLRHSSGVTLSTYARRKDDYSIRVMLSPDDCRSWETEFVLACHDVTPDLGYPSTVELNDGSLLTVYYAHPAKGKPAVIMQQKWRIVK